MSEDQYTAGPDQPVRPAEGQPKQQQSPPGSTRMTPKPDHGEDSYRGSGRLRQARVITGGDSGIGRAVAIAFAREGADVLISYLARRRTPTPGRPCGWSRRPAAGASRYAATSATRRHCQELIDRAADDLGGIDILVNNAAYQMAQDKGILGITTEQFDRVLKTNLYAMFWLCKAAVPHLRRVGDHQHVVDPGVRPVAAAAGLRHHQGGHRQLHQGARPDLAEQGIRVNAVAPGPIWTPLIPATMPEEKVEQFGKDTPEGRPGQPAELAPAYVFFASQESSYVTGEVLGVTGGRPTK